MSEKPTDQNEVEANEPSSAPALPLELSRKLKKLNVVAPSTSTKPKEDSETVTVKVTHKVVAEKPTTPTKTEEASAPSDPLLDDPSDAQKPEVKAAPKTEEAAEPPLSEEQLSKAVGDVEDEYNDTKTDAAVDDIVRTEGDEILEAEDAKHGAAEPIAPPKHRHHFFKKWLGTPLGRWLTFIVILAIAGGIFAVPTARYFVLNHAGVRASLSVTVTDAGTLLPLENATVSMDGQSATTNTNGVATLHHLHLGAQTLAFSHVAYASQSERVVVGWGENPIGSSVALKPTGVRYVVKAVDYFSNAAITGATATESDDTQVPADKNGIITLTLNTNGNASAQATIGAKGYVNVAATLKPNTTNVVVLTPSQPDVYVAKQSGAYNVYSANADGSNAQLLLAGTGLETSQISLATSPDGSEAALVSVRDHIVDSAGKAEQALTLITVANGNASAIDHADQIKLLDWNGTTLVYETITNATNAASAQYAVVSYDYKTATRQQLASSTDFDAVMAADGAVFYSPSSTDTKATVGLYKINDDGSGQQTLLNQEVIGLYRTDYDTLLAQTASGWYSFSLDSSASPQQVATPASHTNVAFVLSPDGANAAAVVDVGGVPTLQITNVSTGKTTKLVAPSPSYPMRWLNDNTLVFRAGGTTPADYGVSIAGGTAKKIVAVFGSNGFVAGE